MNKIILAIDFNNVVFSSYYGKPLLNSNGTNINAVRGFFFKLKSLIDIFNPDHIVFANDLSRAKTFRRKMYKPYKAQRKPADEDIKTQMKYVSTLVSLLGYPMINNELYEADDILGMISRLASDNDMDIVIISSDKDLYQLVNDHTYIMSPRNTDIIDEYWLKNKFGLTPSQWIELKILQGDRGDNVPGVPGIGEVTGLQLLREYNTVEGIYSNIGKLKPPIRKSLIETKNNINLIRDLVTIITDYNILKFDINIFKRKECFPSEIYLLLNELESNSLVELFKYEFIPDRTNS